MVQATDTSVMHKKIDAIRTAKIKTPEKGGKKVAAPLSEAVQYAALPEQFKVVARTVPSLFAQAPGSRKSGVCIPGIKKTTKRRSHKLTSNVKLGTSKLSYSLRLRSDGVDALIHQGGQLYRVPLDVKAKWDAKRQKVIIDGKTLKSSKLVNTGFGQRLHFDSKELAKLVKPQMDALVFEINHRITSSGLAGMGTGLKKVDGALAKLKGRLKRSFKKHSGVLTIRKILVKQHGTLKAQLISLLKQRRKIARLMKRRRGFTKTFRKKLKSLERQNAKLRGRIITLKKKLWGIIYKYWLRGKTVRKRPC